MRKGVGPELDVFKRNDKPDPTQGELLEAERQNNVGAPGFSLFDVRPYDAIMQQMSKFDPAYQRKLLMQDDEFQSEMQRRGFAAPGGQNGAE